MLSEEDAYEYNDDLGIKLETSSFNDRDVNEGAMGQSIASDVGMTLVATSCESPSLQLLLRDIDFAYASILPHID